MASALEAAILQRNALFRAWRELGGVPFEGGWKMHDARAFFSSFCRHRCAYGQGDHVGREEVEALGLEVALRATELKKIAGTVLGGPCPHLAPLLVPPPPEVETLADLLLVENPGPQ